MKSRGNPKKPATGKPDAGQDAQGKPAEGKKPANSKKPRPSFIIEQVKNVTGKKESR